MAVYENAQRSGDCYPRSLLRRRHDTHCRRAERRRCFAMDSDPAACDLAVMRWEQFTGKKARRMKKSLRILAFELVF